MRTIAIAVSMLATSLAHADMDCNKGTPWRLPRPTPPLKHTEAPIKVDGTAGQMVTICNCTDQKPGADGGVWMRASSTKDTQPYYLPAKSCVLAGTATIILAPVDDKVESWGWFAPQP